MSRLLREDQIPFHVQSFVTCHWSIPSVHVPKRPGERNTNQHLISPYNIKAWFSRQVVRINKTIIQEQRELFNDQYQKYTKK